MLSNKRREMRLTAIWAILAVVVPLAVAFRLLGLDHWDLSIPQIYIGSDDIWQLNITKSLLDTGWVLNNPYLGAPGVAHIYNNPAAQTSALHSVLMLGLSAFTHDAVRVQQIYYLINFPLICLTSFFACRLLGIARMPALAAGLLFCFATYRFNFSPYAFLPNYFMIPLALVSVFWVLTGRFATFDTNGLRPSQQFGRLIRSRDFILGLAFVILTGLSDGYYSFFTLILLGFSAFARIVIGDWRRPLTLAPACIYIFSLLGAALLLQLPLYEYKNAHPEEYYPNGVKDLTLFRRPMEAEVYSTDLKMMVAPIHGHRIPFLAKLNIHMGETNDEARTFKGGGQVTPLGTLCSLLFAAALALVAIPGAKRALIRSTGGSSVAGGGSSTELLDAAASLALVIFLFSINGGLGTLVALLFPTIRAYDRFPIFLMFVLYIGAAWFVTQRLRMAGTGAYIAWVVALIAITTAALYDQIPNQPVSANQDVVRNFLAEGRFVKKIEKRLPPNAAVFQFPYSQYLRESKYYGWGSFAGTRLYTQSHDLRWSNGGAKNSPADNWLFTISQLPPDEMVAEVEAAGFQGFVIDRTVVKPAEFEKFREVFLSLGDTVEDDSASSFAFVKLGDPGYRLVYDDGYLEAASILITDPRAALSQTNFSRFIDGDAFHHFIASNAVNAGLVINHADHPELFTDGKTLVRGLGDTAISPITDMLGHMTCSVEKPSDTAGPEMVRLVVDNQTNFDWKFGGGSFPLSIGVHIRGADGTLLSFDDGFRIRSDVYLKHGHAHTFEVKRNAIPMAKDAPVDHGAISAEFALVQDGNAWFGNVTCAVPLN